MNPKALQHLKLLQTVSGNRAGALDFSGQPNTPVAPEEVAAMVAHQREKFGVDHGAQFAEHGFQMSYWLGQLETDLYHDLLGYCNAEERTVMARLALGFLPNLHCNACVLPVMAQAAAPHQSIYVMGVNFGLFQIAGLLCEALLWESENHADKAKRCYQRALDLYFVRTQAQYDQAIRDDGNELHLLKQQSGEIAGVVLRFIALHELGHVVLGHADQLDMQLNSIKSDVVYTQADKYSAEAVLAMETAADRFAIEHMIKTTGSPEQMWNNTLFICALFLLLDHIEIRLGHPLSNNHPPPAQRALGIQTLVEAAIGPPLNDVMLWLPMTMQAWKDG